MKKTNMTETEAMAENQSYILNRSKLFYDKVAVVTALTVMILAAALSLPNLQQRTIAQEQQQHSLSNQTAVDIGTIEDLSFEIDNVKFSHHTASVNGIQMHYVIGGQGDPVVLLHGWPQTWYEWHRVMPALAKNYTVIAPDLRGLGDSSKPVTGYDGNTTAEDIYQLLSQLGLDQKINLVGHDVGVHTAYSYAAAHPNNVSKLVILDVPVPGFYPPGFEDCCWWFSFHQTPDIPEILTAGKEREYLSWFYTTFAYNPEAIIEADIEKYVSKYSAPGGMRAGFEYYRAFSITAEQNKEHSNVKLPMPVLALGGEYTRDAALTSMKSLATDVRGGIVPFSGHWIPEERPDYLVKELAKFLGE
ncbi:MAG TPA: alpha/beta hydrolase [Nitrososphaeraceae archaeon]|nr:alpha/beta hydrolase [Nitrososphaeraceae archaeon]